jgi:hypothetical protein
MLAIGSTIWAPFGNHGWRAATVIQLGKNRKQATVVHLSFENGSKGKRYVGRLYWRKPELRGNDKPPRPAVENLTLS